VLIDVVSLTQLLIDIEVAIIVDRKNIDKTDYRPYELDNQL